MRIGSNPLKRKLIIRDLRPKKHVISVTTHLPDLTTPYHQDRLRIIKASLITARNNAGIDADFLVWDNGSCEELRAWIRYVFCPTYLMTGPNIGKANARANILGMLEPDAIVNLSDDDIFYYPDWFVKQIEILKHFPNVGTVTGYPTRYSFKWGCETAISWANKSAALKIGRIIPDEWERDYAIGTGLDPDKWIMNASMRDYLITYRGMQAYACGHHCQFICEAGVIQKVAKRNPYYMGMEKDFDLDVDAAGLMRLATTERLTRHIGNKINKTLDPEFTLELERLGL